MLMNMPEALEAWKKGCFEQTLAIEAGGYHCCACAHALIDGLKRILPLRKRETPSLWLDVCAHGGAGGTAICARCTARIVKEVERIRPPSLSVPIEFPHDRLGWRP
jgi:hypothetical protein